MIIVLTIITMNLYPNGMYSKSTEEVYGMQNLEMCKKHSAVIHEKFVETPIKKLVATKCEIKGDI